MTDNDSNDWRMTEDSDSNVSVIDLPCSTLPSHFRPPVKLLQFLSHFSAELCFDSMTENDPVFRNDSTTQWIKMTRLVEWKNHWEWLEFFEWVQEKWNRRLPPSSGSLPLSFQWHILGRNFGFTEMTRNKNSLSVNDRNDSKYDSYFPVIHFKNLT